MQRTSPKTKVAVDLDQVLGSFIFKLSVGIVMVLGAVPLCCQLAVDFDHSDKHPSAPCRHLCLCPQCSAHLPEAVCPLCRCGVQQRIETFI